MQYTAITASVILGHIYKELIVLGDLLFTIDSSHTGPHPSLSA